MVRSIPLISGLSLWRISSVSLVLLEPMVVVVSLSLVVLAAPQTHQLSWGHVQVPWVGGPVSTISRCLP